MDESAQGKQPPKSPLFSLPDRLNLAIGVLALVLGGTTFHFQFLREDHKLTALVDGLNITSRVGDYHANVLFRNEGTEHEVVLLSSFAISCARRYPYPEKEMYVTGFVVLAAGETRHFPLKGKILPEELPQCDGGRYQYRFKATTVSPPRAVYFTSTRMGEFGFDQTGFAAAVPEMKLGLSLLETTFEQAEWRLQREVEREQEADSDRHKK